MYLVDDDSGNNNLLALPSRIQLRSSKKKLLILYLNGVLVDMVSDYPSDYKPDKIISRRGGENGFNLVLFFPRNIIVIVNSLTKSLVVQNRRIDDSSHCTKTQSYTLENPYKVLVFKDLKRIWEKHDRELPWEKGYYNESNTVLLDDSPYKALLNPNRNDRSLGGDLRIYLEELTEADDVQKYVEQHPFGQPAITESSESWDFYNQ
ncbi:hypothetical protein Tsubulata_026386, partial [Turnera subulata]